MLGFGAGSDLRERPRAPFSRVPAQAGSRVDPPPAKPASRASRARSFPRLPDTRAVSVDPFHSSVHFCFPGDSL